MKLPYSATYPPDLIRRGSTSRCRPILWLPMALPIGVSTGFISAALANALARAGLAESATATVVATFFWHCRSASCGAPRSMRLFRDAFGW